MAAIRKILIPIDGSDNSLRALAYVAKRAQSDKLIRVMLLNVQPRLPESMFVSRSMIKQHQKLQSESAIAAARKRLARLGLDAECYVLIGEPAQTIIDTARKMRVAEIVMGNRGLGGLKGLLLGSITTKVIPLAQIPVTVVP